MSPEERSAYFAQGRIAAKLKIPRDHAPTDAETRRVWQAGWDDAVRNPTPPPEPESVILARRTVELHEQLVDAADRQANGLFAISFAIADLAAAIREGLKR